MIPWAVLLVLVFVGACRRSPGRSTDGANSSQEAVMQFLDAARAQDIQAMSAVWGDAEAPARERLERQELERRLIIIARTLCHDSATIAASTPGEGGRLVHRADITKGARTVTVPFTTARNRRSGQWFVEDIDLRPARDLCNTGTPSTRRSL
jgi:hypothetical protein